MPWTETKLLWIKVQVEGVNGYEWVRVQVIHPGRLEEGKFKTCRCWRPGVKKKKKKSTFIFNKNRKWEIAMQKVITYPIFRLFPVSILQYTPTSPLLPAPEVMKAAKIWTQKNLQAKSLDWWKRTPKNRSRVKEEKNIDPETNRHTFCGPSHFCKKVQMLTVFTTSCYFAPNTR